MTHRRANVFKYTWKKHICLRIFFYQLSGHRGYSFGFRGPMKVIFWVKTQKTIQKFCDIIFTKHNLIGSGARFKSKMKVFTVQS